MVTLVNYNQMYGYYNRKKGPSGGAFLSDWGAEEETLIRLKRSNEEIRGTN
jgi:hypothetical protein